MVKYKGRSALKQYVPKKPIRRGFKVWVRADNHNGFVCDFQVYTGKGEASDGPGRRQELPLVLLQLLFVGGALQRSAGGQDVCVWNLQEVQGQCSRGSLDNPTS